VNAVIVVRSEVDAREAAAAIDLDSFGVAREQIWQRIAMPFGLQQQIVFELPALTDRADRPG
jgi:hypothetical protein